MAIALPIASDPLLVTHHRNLAANRSIRVPTISTLITPQDCGAIFMIATDALVMTLPLVATLDPGFWVTFVHAMAAGGALLTITPNGADGIWGTIVNDAGAGVVFTASGVAGTFIRLTKATAKVSNQVTLFSSGLTDWYMSAGTGIWTN